MPPFVATNIALDFELYFWKCTVSSARSTRATLGASRHSAAVPLSAATVMVCMVLAYHRSVSSTHSRLDDMMQTRLILALANN